MDRAITVSPFTLMKLVLKHSIVSLLSKPQALEKAARACAMTLDEAKEIRLKLMKERSMADAADRDDPDRFFNLCEY